MANAQSIQSMTGFGSGEAPFAEHRAKVEVKSVNHRSLDCKVRLPRELSSLENQIKAEVQSRFSRGSFDISVEIIENPQSARKAFGIDVDLAARYVEALRELKSKLSIRGEIETRDLLLLPDLFNRKVAPSSNSEALWSALMPALDQALNGLKAARMSEGAALRDVLLAGAAEIRSVIESISRKRTGVEAEFKKKIQDRIQRLLEVYPIHDQPVQTLMESRVAQELAAILDRTDFEEERVRFLRHLEQLDATLKSKGPVGRKLDFTLQEMNREINTLGNKAQDYSVSEEVVRVKVRLEQIREQCMNLE